MYAYKSHDLLVDMSTGLDMRVMKCTLARGVSTTIIPDMLNTINLFYAIH